MPEPTTTSIAAVAAAASAVSLALFGVDYYSLLYGFIGAMLAMRHADTMGRGRAVVYVALATFVGAVIGNAVLAYFDSKSRALLIFGCLVGGLVAQILASAIVNAAPTIADAAIKRLSGFIGGFGGGRQ